MTPPRTEPEPMPNGVGFAAVCRRVTSAVECHCAEEHIPPCPSCLTDAAAMTALAELLEQINEALVGGRMARVERLVITLRRGYHPTPEPRTARPLGSWVYHPLVSFAPSLASALQLDPTSSATLSPGGSPDGP